MMLIRWIGTEIRIFAYLQNTVLIVCFFGLGMGCFTCRQPIHLRRTIIARADDCAIVAGIDHLCRKNFFAVEHAG